MMHQNDSHNLNLMDIPISIIFFHWHSIKMARLLKIFVP